MKAPSNRSVIKYTMVASMDVLSAKRWIRVRDLCTEYFNRAQNNPSLPFAEMEEPFAIEISFRKLLDETLRDRCDRIPTRFKITPGQLADLDRAVPDLVRGDAHMKRLGRSLAAEFRGHPEALRSLEDALPNMEAPIPDVRLDAGTT